MTFPVQDMADFNPRPPRGGRLGVDFNSPYYPFISIHAPREGGDYWHDFSGDCR